MPRLYQVAKPGELRVSWGFIDGCWDTAYSANVGSDSKRDVNALWWVLEGKNLFGAYEENSLLKELERRGYDISTLQFSIQKAKV